MVVPVLTLFRRFVGDQDGNVLLVFALLLVPLLIAIGMGLDFARAYSVRLELQADLDASVLAVTRKLSTDDAETVETAMQQWFAAEATHKSGDYTVEDLDVSVGSQEITAVVKATVPTTLLALAHIDTISVSAKSSAAAPSNAYLDVYIVLDKSASMLLAATSAGQQQLTNQASCAFACHEVEGGPFSYGGKTYNTVYDLSVAMGVQLRTDVAIDAVKEVLDMVDAADAGHNHIRVGFYTIGNAASEVLSPTYSTGTARATLADDSSGLTSATSETASFFDWSLEQLSAMVGSAGDGSIASAPKKLVLILTDGVQSERNWVLETASGIRFPTATSQLQTLVGPFNPGWCDTMKTNDVSVGVLYTRYLPITTDWGYKATLAKTMGSSSFTSVWNGELASGGSSQTRQAYIPTALSACASSASLYLQADSSSEIESGLSTLLKEYLTQVRLSR